MVPMGMNIKSERAHDLARRVAALAGTSQTSAVEHALERYLHDLERQGATGATRVDRVDRVLAALDARLSDEDRVALRTADLYDEAGLPQ